MRDFQVIEDPLTRCLSLAVFASDGVCEYFRTGLEANKQILTNIEGIQAGQDPAREWLYNCTRLLNSGSSIKLEGTPESLYLDTMRSNLLPEVVADQRGIYPDVMSSDTKKIFDLYRTSYRDMTDETGCITWGQRNKQFLQGAQRLLDAIKSDAKTQKTLDSVLEKLKTIKQKEEPAVVNYNFSAEDLKSTKTFKLDPSRITPESRLYLDQEQDFILFMDYAFDSDGEPVDYETVVQFDLTHSNGKPYTLSEKQRIFEVYAERCCRTAEEYGIGFDAYFYDNGLPLCEIQRESDGSFQFAAREKELPENRLKKEEQIL